MAYKTKFDGSTNEAIQLGGINPKTQKENPTSIEGYFLGTRDTDGEYGPGKLHIFQTEKGTVGVWGKARLNGLLTSELVGQMVLVTFTGMVAPTKKGRKPAYGYEVQHDNDNVIDTTGINLNSAPVVADNDYSDNGSEDLESEFQDEIVPARNVKATNPARAANAEQQAKVKALLSGKRA